MSSVLNEKNLPAKDERFCKFNLQDDESSEFRILVSRSLENVVASNSYVCNHCSLAPACFQEIMPPTFSLSTPLYLVSWATTPSNNLLATMLQLSVLAFSSGTH
jgi:hypothetical protein